MTAPKTDTDCSTSNSDSVTRRHILGALAAGTALTAIGDHTIVRGQETTTTMTDQPVTAVFGLVRQDGMSHEEFTDYFLNEHVPLTKQNLEAGGVDVLAYRSIVPLAPEDSPFDGIGQLTFPNAATFQRVSDTEGWEEAITDVENFTNTDQNVVIVGTEQEHLTGTTVTTTEETTS